MTQINDHLKELQSRCDAVIGTPLNVTPYALDIPSYGNALNPHTLKEINYTDKPLLKLTYANKHYNAFVKISNDVDPKLANAASGIVPLSVSDLSHVQFPFADVSNDDVIGLRLATVIPMMLKMDDSGIPERIILSASKVINEYDMGNASQEIQAYPDKILRSLGVLFYVERQLLLDSKFRTIVQQDESHILTPADAMNFAVDDGTDGCITEDLLDTISKRLNLQAKRLPELIDNTDDTPFTQDFDSVHMIIGNALNDVLNLEVMMAQDTDLSYAYRVMFAILFKLACKMVGLTDDNYVEWTCIGDNSFDDQVTWENKPELYYKSTIIWHNLVYYSLPSEVRKTVYENNDN